MNSIEELGPGSIFSQLRPPLVAPQGESRSDAWIVFELAKRLGLADQLFGGDAEAALTQMLAWIGPTPEAVCVQHPAASPWRWKSATGNTSRAA